MTNNANIGQLSTEVSANGVANAKVGGVSVETLTAPLQTNTKAKSGNVSIEVSAQTPQVDTFSHIGHLSIEVWAVRQTRVGSAQVVM